MMTKYHQLIELRQYTIFNHAAPFIIEFLLERLMFVLFVSTKKR